MKNSIHRKFAFVLLAIILIFTTIIVSFLIWKKIDENDENEIEFNDNNYEYIKLNNPKDIFWQYNPILYYTGTTSGASNIPGVSYDLLNPISGSETIWNDNDLCYGSPVFRENKLIGYFGADLVSDGKGAIFNDFDKNIRIGLSRGSHEYYINDEFAIYIGPEIKNNFYIANMDSLENEVPYDFLELFNFPNVHDVFVTEGEDFTHFNSFDIWKDDLIINSRNLSTIFSIKLFDNGKILSPNEIELNWLLPSDPTSIYFLGNNDITNQPVINEDGAYVQNFDYIPVEFNTYKNKVISPMFNGLKYDFEDNELAREYALNIEHKNKFFGEHKVSVINTLIENNPDIIDIEYSDELIYLSIFDNHWPGNAEGVKPSLYTMWNPQYSELDSDKDVSYTKILAVNTTNKVISGIDPMSYEVIFNYNNSSSTSNDMFSTIISSSIFFAIDDNYYLSATDGMGRTTMLVKFKSINTKENKLDNEELIYEISFKPEYTVGTYRAYPIFNDISNIDYGWNLMNLQ